MFNLNTTKGLQNRQLHLGSLIGALSKVPNKYLNYQDYQDINSYLVEAQADIKRELKNRIK